ncbi:MAG TPA: ABC transporter permease [Candidatus Acidoferrales bacterium]|nr:ABC transporter permease [Candidatus Acidoferrales bacterium]
MRKSKRMMEELDEDIREHIAREIEENMERGMTPEEARSRAMRKFGSVTRVKEETRSVWSFVWVEELLRDMRFATRMLRKSPGFTAAAVLTLALGIGANTAIFSFIEAVILKSLPVHNPKELVLFGPADGAGNSDGFPDDDMNLFSYSMYRTMQQKCGVFSGVAAIASFSYVEHGLVGPGSAMEPVDVRLVSGTYFNVLGVSPAAGRLLSDRDDRVLGGSPVAVASYGWWTRRFGRDPSAMGKTIEIGGTSYTIVGVAQQGFQGTTVGESPDVWIPLQMADAVSRGPHKVNDKMYRWLDIIARLEPGVTMTKAQADVNVVLKTLLGDYAGAAPPASRLDDIRKAHITLNSAATGISFLRQEFSKPLWMLMGIVGFVLLIACANIANLLLARSTMRRREMAMRMALGAGRSRLFRQMVTEGLLLAVLGGATGMLFAVWACKFLLRMLSSGPALIPIDLTPDRMVLAFAFAVTVITSVLFSALPAWQATSVDPNLGLGEGRSAVSYPTRSLLGKALIAGQVALSLVLLVGAGLFVHSLIDLAKVNTGFNPQHMLEIWVDPSATGYTDDARLTALYHQVEQNVDAAPGVVASSFSIFTFSGGQWGDSAHAEGSARAREENVSLNAVGTGYFQAMGLPILMGRSIGPEDSASGRRVAMINHTMAERVFGGASPLGKEFELGGLSGKEAVEEVVGVVADAKYLGLDERPISMVYLPYTQYVPDWGVGLYLGKFVVRYSGDARQVVPEVKHAIEIASPRLPIGRVFSMSEKVEKSILYPRLVAQLSGFFGLLAALLSSLGIYGLLSYTVSRRTNEIGVRMALGAPPSQILKMVLGQGFATVGFGVIAGVVAAAALSRLVGSFLFGITALDPLSYLSAAILLAMVALVSCYIPARRAMNVDPIKALRYE